MLNKIPAALNEYFLLSCYVQEILAGPLFLGEVFFFCNLNISFVTQTTFFFPLMTIPLINNIDQLRNKLTLQIIKGSNDFKGKKRNGLVSLLSLFSIDLRDYH
jgi:hypothetical protein